MKQIFIVTALENFFGQHENRRKSLDVEKLYRLFKEAGQDVQLTNYHSVINGPAVIEDAFIFYSGTKHAVYNAMIEDVVLYLSDKNILLPRYDFLRAYENKGYQELLLRKLRIETLKSFYFSNIAEMSSYDISFPVVYKPVSGAGSTGVCKVHSLEEITALSVEKDKWYWQFSKKDDFWDTYKYKIDWLTKRFVLQEFLPGLDSDYKILIFGDRFYGVKRSVRPGDFRASGSGSFEHVELEDRLLDYAKSIFEKLGTPYASLDVCEYNKQFYLIEFQCLHIGPLVHLTSQGFYQYINDGWRFQEESPDLEKAYCRSILHYIDAYS